MKIGSVQTGNARKVGEVGMIFARLNIHDYGSEPYLFCSKCKALMLRSEYHFCPWCGHKFKPATKVQIIETDENEMSEKSFADKINFIKKEVKWE